MISFDEDALLGTSLVGQRLRLHAQCSMDCMDSVDSQCLDSMFQAQSLVRELDPTHHN